MLTLDILHETHYRYGTRVEQAQHLAHLRPRALRYQQIHEVQLTIDPFPQYWTQALDAFGNARDSFSLYVPHRHLKVRASSRVTLTSKNDANFVHNVVEPTQAASCAQVMLTSQYDVSRPYAEASEFVFASPFVPRLAALYDYAAPSIDADRPVVAAALELMQRIYSDFTYTKGATEIHTPLEQVLKNRRGVCQDFAHLMIGALRAHRLPARYVSGYLLTQPIAGKPKLLGADASHAWVSVWCPPLGWVDFDPTNNVLPGAAHTHITLSMGRDYGDVTPLRGVIRGGDDHVLDVSVSVIPLV